MSEFEEFEEKAKAIGGKLKSRALELAKQAGEAAKELTEEQLEHLDILTVEMGKAILGDEGAKLKLDASLALRNFGAQAQAYLEAQEIVDAVVQALKEIGEELVDAAGKLVANSLANLLAKTLEG